MNREAVIFDLDGTLLDTLQDIADSVNEALKILNFATHRVEAYKSFVGNGIDVLAARALPDNHRDNTNISRMLELINKEYAKRWANKTVPYQGISNLLDELTVRDIKIAVLSNKPHDFTEITVSKLLSRWHFEAVIGTSPSVTKKPNPAAALRIAQQLEIHPSAFLYLGDSGVDMKTATSAGMHPIGVLWGFRPAEELLSNGAEALISSPEELIPFL